MFRFSLSLAAVLGAALSLAPRPLHAAPTDTVLGTWMFEDGDSAVDLYDCAGLLCGRISWLKPAADGTPRHPKDAHNPDAALRGRPVCGLTFITGLRPDGADAWEDGRIYSIGSGSSYDLKLTRRSATELRLRGYKGIPMLGQSFSLTRAPAGLGRCAP